MIGEEKKGTLRLWGRIERRVKGEGWEVGVSGRNGSVFGATGRQSIRVGVLYHFFSF